MPLQVLPGPAPYDVFNVRAGHPECFSQGARRFSGGSSRAERENLRIGETTAGAGFAYWRVRTAFGDHISHVVGVGPEPQMRRITARPVIATVEDVQASRNRPVGNLPCDTVSGAAPQATVAGAVDIAAPWPTRFRVPAFYLSGESLSKWGATRHTNVMVPDEPQRLAAKDPGGLARVIRDFGRLAATALAEFHSSIILSGGGTVPAPTLPWKHFDWTYFRSLLAREAE